MDPGNPMLRDYAADVKAYDYLVPSIELGRRYFDELAASAPGIEVRQMRRGCPHCRICITERTAAMTPYFYASRSCPLWLDGSSSVLYEQISQEFEQLWQLNAPA
jgi:hypothetical protein